MWLSAADRGLLVELERELADLRKPAHGATAMRMIHELFDAQLVARWGFERVRDRLELKDIATAGHTPRPYFRELDEGVRSGQLSFLFSARVPERAQRNTPVVVAGARSILTMKRNEADRLGLTLKAYRDLVPGLERIIALHDKYDLADHYQLRTLICDGPLVLCYFNTVQEQAFTRRQRQIYGRVLALVRRRTLVDHRLAVGDRLGDALEAALEALGRAAFVVDSYGRIVHANQLGIAALDDDAGLVERLIEVIAGVDHDFDVFPFAGRQFLLLRKTCDLAQVVAVLAGELGLRRRAREVLQLAAAGESSKAIASRLAIAENTVEYHLTQIYRRLGVASRFELQRWLFDRLAGRRSRFK